MNRYLLEIKKRFVPFSTEEEYYLSLLFNGKEVIMDFYIAKYLNIDYDLYNDLKNKYNGIYNRHDCLTYFKKVSDIIYFQNELLEIIFSKNEF